jgi:hypothetical protein
MLVRSSLFTAERKQACDVCFGRMPGHVSFAHYFCCVLSCTVSEGASGLSKPTVPAAAAARPMMSLFDEIRKRRVVE